MIENVDSTDLTGKLLIAMPGMSDPRFEKSVVYLCAHSSEETMGLIINKPAPGLDINDMFRQLRITTSGATEIAVHFGGPVENGRGFVLHSGEYACSDGTMKVDPRFHMTANKEVLEAIAAGTGPEKAVLMLGYAGWGPGQLEYEIVQNGWLVTDPTPEILFGSDSSIKWVAALDTLGIDPIALSTTAGRA